MERKFIVSSKSGAPPQERFKEPVKVALITSWGITKYEMEKKDALAFVKYIRGKGKKTNKRLRNLEKDQSNESGK